MKHHPRSGFTLLELSMVIVIIALITGAIFVGENMLRASQLRGAVSEMQKYTQAIGDFQDKYHALPGDFSGGTALWGSAANGTNCDGVGNGTLSGYEMYCAWWHLMQAGLIPGSYTGVSVMPMVGGEPTTKTGVNAPASQVSGAGWEIFGTTMEPFNGGYLINMYNVVSFGLPYVTGDIPYGTTLVLGGANLYTGGIPVFTPLEAFQIDSKLDDGLAATGKVIGYTQNGLGGCASGGTNGLPSPVYDLTITTFNCSLAFKTGF